MGWGVLLSNGHKSARMGYSRGNTPLRLTRGTFSRLMLDVGRPGSLSGATSATPVQVILTAARKNAEY